MMKIKPYKLILALLAAFLLAGNVNGQGIVERYVKGIENVETNLHFIYQGTYIPVLDITYHEFSSDSLTWRKEYEDGDCYIRFNNFTDNSTNPYNGLTGYHPDTTWWVFNFCTCNGAITDGTGTSNIDTIFVNVGGVVDTVTMNNVTINITQPDTVSGSSTNYQDSLNHTHELFIYIGDNEDVDTTGRYDGSVLKWNATTEMWEVAPDLIGGGSSGSLTVSELDGAPDVGNVTEIVVTNGHLTNLGAGRVYLDLTLDPIKAENDYWRAGKVRVPSGDNFITFDSPLPANDYILVSAYALLDIQNTRQNLKYDSLAIDGFRVLSVVDSAYVHYLAIRNVDSLLSTFGDIGRVYGSPTDTTLEYLSQSVDDTTITVVNNELHVIGIDSLHESKVYIDNDGNVNETLYDQNAHTGIPHIGSGGVVTDLGNDSIAISSAEAYIKTSNSDGGYLKVFLIEADTLFIPDNLNYIVYIDYNAGNPVFKTRESTPGYFYSNWDELPFATVVNIESQIIVRNFKNESLNSSYKSILGQINYQPARYLGGLDVSDESSLQFSVEAGAVLFGNDYSAIASINTSSTDTFTRVYYDGGWQRVSGEQTVNTTQYNDTAQGLVSLRSDFYTIKWLYYVKDNPSYWVVLDGQSEYGSYSNIAEVTEPPYLPPELSKFYAGSVLVGKLVVQQGKTEFIAIQNPFDVSFGDPEVGMSKSYSFTSQGVGAGTYFVGGFYNYSATDANLTQASLAQTYGTANVAHASHPFIVCSGAGTVNSGVVGLRVTGTRIQDDGTRTASFSDTIITDITSVTANQYIEAEKFIGTVTYQLIVISGTPTTYSFDFNYGLVKYEDFGNKNFDVNGFECVGLAGAADVNFNITLIHHNDQDWVYAATGFVITPTVIADLITTYTTEYALANGKPFAFKLSPVGYSDIIQGSDSEGVIIRVVAGANNSVQSMDIHLGVRIIN